MANVKNSQISVRLARAQASGVRHLCLGHAVAPRDPPGHRGRPPNTAKVTHRVETISHPENICVDSPEITTEQVKILGESKLMPNEITSATAQRMTED